MRTFRSPGEFARFLSSAATRMDAAERRGLRQAADIMRREARSYIGVYQGEAGPFPEWRPLAESTLYGGVDSAGKPFQGKIELGYATAANHHPLLREGDLRSSIEGASDHESAVVGSNSDVAVYQEMGTAKIPPRSFLGRALHQTADPSLRAVAIEVLGELIGPAAARALLRG